MPLAAISQRHHKTPATGKMQDKMQNKLAAGFIETELHLNEYGMAELSTLRVWLSPCALFELAVIPSTMSYLL